MRHQAQRCVSYGANGWLAAARASGSAKTKVGGARRWPPVTGGAVQRRRSPMIRQHSSFTAFTRPTIPEPCIATSFLSSVGYVMDGNRMCARGEEHIGGWRSDLQLLESDGDWQPARGAGANGTAARINKQGQYLGTYTDSFPVANELPPFSSCRRLQATQHWSTTHQCKNQNLT
jgi:hypothetical protein